MPTPHFVQCVSSTYHLAATIVAMPPACPCSRDAMTEVQLLKSCSYVTWSDMKVSCTQSTSGNPLQHASTHVTLSHVAPWMFQLATSSFWAASQADGWLVVGALEGPSPAWTPSMFACLSLGWCCCAGASEVAAVSWPPDGAGCSSMVASSGSGGCRVGGSGRRRVALLDGVVAFLPFFCCTFFQTPPLVVLVVVALCLGGGSGRGGPSAIGLSVMVNSAAGARCAYSLLLLVGIARASCCLQRCLFCPVVVA